MEKLNKDLKDLSKEELLALATSLGLANPDSDKLSKKELVVVITKWEKAKAKALKHTPPVVEPTEAGAPDEEWALGLHDGKKVVSRVSVELNGKNYVDITVESGETYRV